MNFFLKNDYYNLSSDFYYQVKAENFSDPYLIKLNEELDQNLGSVFSSMNKSDLAKIFSAQVVDEKLEPMAMVYAAHQFGHFVPKLGDGRAMILGQLKNRENIYYDIQLKGAGRTPYSRNGDGKSAIGPVIREYLVSEGMYHLGIPTTRALACVFTNQSVIREREIPGGILTRVAKSHIRIGSFQYFYAKNDLKNLRILADFSIEKLYPELRSDRKKYLSFFKKVSERQILLIAKWMSVGFIHGVMNTDNTSISGETIDYGPCAFIDEFSFDKCFSYIDRNSRYCFSNQPQIILWNLSRFAECLIPLIDEQEQKSIETFKDILIEIEEHFEKLFLNEFCQKLGIECAQKKDKGLIQKFLHYLESNHKDFTLSFRNLSKLILNWEDDSCFEDSGEFLDFKLSWRARLKEQNNKSSDIIDLMDRTNPVYIPRNHMIEKAITSAENEDFTLFYELVEALKSPFCENKQFDFLKTPPSINERVLRTFCGT